MAHTKEEIAEYPLKELADLGLALSKEAKEIEASLKLIKDRFKEEATKTAVFEFMGSHSKVVIQGQNNVEIPARAFYKAMKEQKKETAFWGTVKISVTEARKAAPDIVEKVGVVTFNPMHAVVFK